MINIFKGLFSKSYEDLGGRDFKNMFINTPGAVLLDVRTAGEFKAGHINGAKNIDGMSLDFQNEAEKLDKSKTYFVYCRSGGRSGQACNVMSSMGFKVYNLSGGIYSWPR